MSLYPSEELLQVLNTIGVPHSSEVNEKWLTLPLKFSEKKMWKTNDKINVLRLRSYIYHYLNKNNFIINKTVIPNDLLKILDHQFEKMDYKYFIHLLDDHLYKY